MLVAAVFVCLFFLRNELVFKIVERQIQSLNLENPKLKFNRISKNEFGLELLTSSSTSQISSRWKPVWNLSERELQLEGTISYLNQVVFARIRVPLELTLNPVSMIKLDASGSYEKAEWSLEAEAENISKVWVGNAKSKIVHSVWGEVNPRILFKYDEPLQLSILLEPGQIKSSRVQVREKIVFELKSEKTDELFSFLGSVPAVSFVGLGLKSVDDALFKGNIQGKLGLNQKNDFILSARGKLKDHKNSVEIPFVLDGVNQNIHWYSKFVLELFEGALVERLVSEVIPGTKLLNGSLRGELNHQRLRLDLEPTSLVLGDTLFTGLEGNAEGDLKKQILSFKNLRFGLADGAVEIQPFMFSRKAPETVLNFSISDLQLKKLLSNYPRSKLSGQGLLKGRGTLMLGPDGVSMSKLDLINSTPGVIQYGDTSQPYFGKSVIYLDEFEDLLNQGQQALVLKALENFHYTSLKIQLDRLSAQRLKVLLNLKGKNPELAKGQLFDITLPVEGDLDSLVKGSLLQRPVIDELHKRHLEME